MIAALGFSVVMFSFCTQDAGQLAELARFWGLGWKVLQVESEYESAKKRSLNH